jgi:hypothetical protein
VLYLHLALLMARGHERCKDEEKALLRDEEDTIADECVD